MKKRDDKREGNRDIGRNVPLLVVRSVPVRLARNRPWIGEHDEGEENSRGNAAEQAGDKLAGQQGDVLGENWRTPRSGPP